MCLQWRLGRFGCRLSRGKSFIAGLRLPFYFLRRLPFLFSTLASFFLSLLISICSQFNCVCHLYDEPGKFKTTLVLFDLKCSDVIVHSPRSLRSFAAGCLALAHGTWERDNFGELGSMTVTTVTTAARSVVKPKFRLHLLVKISPYCHVILC